jgi:alpha-beta hydrolase superfamily lysophospholipase
MKHHLLASTFLVIAALALSWAAAIAFGGPGNPSPMPAINNPFKSVDFSGMPPQRAFKGADGVDLYFREYKPKGEAASGSAVLVHGSSASSNSMHPMAKALAAAGLHVFALDIRGHGSSGQKGQIDYIGQLESDLQAFMQSVRPPAPVTLVGFSSGGGFTLRVAASRDRDLFQSYLLLSPYLGRDSPTQRPNSGGWISVGVPRAVGLYLLNAIGVSALNRLPVVRFALSDEARSSLTPEYGFNLTMNFAPHRDFMADIRAAGASVAVIAGDADEAFNTGQLEAVVRGAGKNWPVRLLPGIGHIPLTLEPKALESVAQQVRTLQHTV